MFDASTVNELGFWNVYTESDRDGFSTKFLGTFYGHLDDIAFSLSGSELYSLSFKKVDEKSCKVDPVLRPSRRKVDVSIYGVYSRDSKVKLNLYRNILANRNVGVSDESYKNDCVTLVFSGTKSVEEIKEEAISKLTPEEQEILRMYGFDK